MKGKGKNSQERNGPPSARAVGKRFRINVWHVGLLASLLAFGYWMFIASDRFVSEAHIVIQRTDSNQMPGASDVSALLMGTPSNNAAEQLLLQGHLLSVDMLEKIDSKLNLRAHYSDESKDILSRLSSEDIESELFYEHYLSRVEIEFDDTSGILLIRAQAYDPKTAYAIANMLVEEGERYMNTLVHRLAEEQVQFLEKQVSARADAVNRARQAMADFQNKHGLVSPKDTLVSLATVVNKLEGQLTELRAKRSALLGYLSTEAPAVVEVDLQIEALERQIGLEQARLASTQGDSLNQVVEQYQLLQMEAQFVTDIYKAALTSLEAGRVEATRTLKKVSVLQSPTMPQYSLEPRRLYNSVLFFLLTMLVTGVVQLLISIERDHKD